MKVTRIMANVATDDLGKAQAFYGDILGLDRMQQAGVPVEYGPVNEPWGVRRFYVRDPFDRLLNILQHE